MPNSDETSYQQKWNHQNTKRVVRRIVEYFPSFVDENWFYMNQTHTHLSIEGLQQLGIVAFVAVPFFWASSFDPNP